MSNGFIYVVDAHFIDKIEENKYPVPKCLWSLPYYMTEYIFLETTMTKRKSTKGQTTIY
jgi:hypothetical protein